MHLLLCSYWESEAVQAGLCPAEDIYKMATVTALCYLDICDYSQLLSSCGLVL